MEQDKAGMGKTQGANSKDREDSRRVVIYALSMALGTLSSRILGLLRDMAFAALFSRAVTDAWTAAFRLPNLFRRLLGEGSLSVSFIPVFVEARVADPTHQAGVASTHHAKEQASRSHNLVNSFYTLLLLVLGVLTTIGIIWAEPILAVLLDERYTSDPEKMLMTVRMAKIMFGFIFLMSNYAYFMGVLNALGHFGIPAAAPVLFNVAMIISTLVPSEWFPFEGDGIAWGVIVGGILQAGVLVPMLIQKGYWPKLSFDFKNADVLRVLKNMAPGLLGTGLLQITTIVNLKFASSLGEGAISYIFWADRLLELPLSLVAVSLGTALLPTLSSLWSRGQTAAMISTSNYYLRLNLFVAVPAAVGLYVLALPIVELLFKRGRFTDADAQATASVVGIYAFILVASSSVRVLVPAYYAIKNTWWPAVVSGLSLAAHILIAPVLMDTYGLRGLVSSSFLSAALNFCLLAFLFRKFIGIYQWGLVFKSFSKFLLASIAMGYVVDVFYAWIKPLSGDGELGRIVAVGLSILAGLAVFVAANIFLKTEEQQVTLNTVLNKLKRKLKPKH